MTRIESSVIVSAPVAEVFAYASDWRRWHEWFVGLSGTRPITGVTRGSGAQYAYKVRLMCFSAGVVTEIADFVENVGWRGIGRKGMPHFTFWRFEASGSQTRFTYALEYRVPVPLLGAWLDAALLKPQWVRIIDSSLANVRRHFEAT